MNLQQKLSLCLSPSSPHSPLSPIRGFRRLIIHNFEYFKWIHSRLSPSDSGRRVEREDL